MTDNEIIELLNECDTTHIKIQCVESILSDTRDVIHLDLSKIVDILNRQKAEIDRLKDYPKCVYEYDGDITDYCLKTPCPNYKTVDAIRIEAVKEFAEKVKAKIFLAKFGKGRSSFSVTTIDPSEIDSLVKEMVGE